MNRNRFMKELEQLLWDLPAGERQEAIQYYSDYFDDAGPENEARVIKELGSPAQVAETIREGMSENGEYTERGYEDARFTDRRELSAGRCEEAVEPPRRTQGSNPWKLLSILLLCLLLLPVVVPLSAALLIIAVAILLGIAGLMLGAVAAAVALPVAGIILLGLAFYNLFFLPGVGVTLAGLGCLLLAAGILIFLLVVWILKVLVPVGIRSIVSVVRFPLRKAGVVK